jgi:hypothetical protein
MIQHSTHESLTRGEDAAPGSERSFAIAMTVAFALLAAISWRHERHVWAWFGGIAVIFFIAGWLWPMALRPVNRIWFKFGLLLHEVINPIVMALIFYVVVWPTGLVMRAMGKDPLRLELEPERDSYWIMRRPPGPAPESMKDQF